MKVWVCYNGGGYEGYSKPLAVYSSENMALAWKKGAVDNYGNMAHIQEFDLVVSNEPS